MTDEIVNEVNRYYHNKDRYKLKFQHIPAVAALDLDITNIDVFCEEGVYDAEQTRRICEAGKVRFKQTQHIGKVMERNTVHLC